MNDLELLKDLETRVCELEQLIELMQEKFLVLHKQMKPHDEGFHTPDPKTPLKRDELLSIGEVVAILNVPSSNIKEWIKQKKLSGIRMGNTLYFKRDDIKKVFRALMMNMEVYPESED